MWSTFLRRPVLLEQRTHHPAVFLIVPLVSPQIFQEAILGLMGSFCWSDLFTHLPDYYFLVVLPIFLSKEGPFLLKPPPALQQESQRKLSSSNPIRRYRRSFLQQRFRIFNCFIASLFNCFLTMKPWNNVTISFNVRFLLIQFLNSSQVLFLRPGGGGNESFN